MRSERIYMIRPNFNKKIIILDIDQTLIQSKRINSKTKFGELGDFNICNNGYTIYKRPYVDNFIEWCFNNFDGVIVWSAGTKDYVYDIVRHLFKSTYKPTMVLTKDSCTTDEYHKDVSILDIKLKDFGINLDTSEIYFVDDIPCRIKNLKPQNIIPIKPYCTRRHVYRNRTFSGDRDDHLLKIKKMSYNIR